jgi:hypothetical protein
VTSSLAQLTAGEDRSVTFALAVTNAGDVPASFGVIRVAGLDGLDVGVEKSFGRSVSGLEFAGAVAVGVLRVMVDPLGAIASLFSRKEVSFEIPDKHTGFGSLRVFVPADAKAGRYEGRVEVEGNTGALSFPVAIDVVDYRARIERAIAAAQKPLDRIPLGAALDRAKRDAKGRASVTADFDDRSPEIEQFFGRWVLTDRGIWDLSTLEWCGPLLAATPGLSQQRLAGQLRRPQLYVVNGYSLDVIDVVDRRTVARLATADEDPLVGDFVVSVDGTRVVAATISKGLYLFEGAGERWTRTKLPFPDGKYPRWIVADPDLRREVLAAESDETNQSLWCTIHRISLDDGEASAVTIKGGSNELKPAYDPGRGLLAVPLVMNGEYGVEKATLAVVRTASLTVFRYETVTGNPTVWIDEATGDVVLVGRASSAIVKPGAARAEIVERQLSRAPLRVAGTDVTCELGSGSATLSR